MERMKNEDFDCFLLRMEREFNGTGKQGEKNGGEREFACGFGFRIRIPPNFREGGKEEAEGIFWSQDRPPVLFLTPDRRAGITFCQMETEDAADACMGRIRQALQRADGRTVFYGSGAAGKNGDIPWLEYKSFAADERVYNLAFLFAAGGGCVMGTFYCALEDYDKWKPVVFGMLDTVKTTEEEGGYR